MNTILLEKSLNPQELNRLRKEFPQYKLRYYQFHRFGEESKILQANTGWSGVEILFGNHINIHQLKEATNLRWIHNPTTSFSRICLDEIFKQGNIIVTTGSEEYLISIGEFVMGATLAFAKNLFFWQTLKNSPEELWNSKNRDTMWTLADRVFLQIGLGKAGTEIARQAKQMKLHVWGMQKHRSFHPHCERTIPMQDLASILPEVDIVSICLPREDHLEDLFTVEELNMMKKDSILIVLGSHTIVNEHALVEVGKTGKFKGIILDALYSPTIPATSPLWQIPNIIITPEVSSKPRTSSKQMFPTFYYNLRQYAFENFKDMRNRILPRNGS